MRSGGGSFGQIGLHVGADWWTFLNTYDGWGGRNGHSCRPGCPSPAGAW